ncbi:MAG TPA: ArsR family transcriptional regulator [Myxococcota bacterium]
MAKNERRPRSAAAPAVAVRPRPRIKAKKRPAGVDREMPKEIAVFDPDAVEKVLDVLPAKETVGRLADRIAGLSTTSRLEALIALQAAELCVGDVSAVLGLSMSATSTMLKQLRALNLLSIRHAGKQTYYRLADKRVTTIIELARGLDDVVAD